MKKLTAIFGITLSLVFAHLQAQVIIQENLPATKRLETDIRLLASDSLLGRESGTPGEYMARKYIESEFKQIGLTPLFDTSYFQAFAFKDEAFVDLGTQMTLNGKKLQLYVDYYPLGFSANQSVQGDMVFAGNGLVNPEAGMNDYSQCGSVSGKIVLLDLSVPDSLYETKSIWDSAQKIVRVKRAQALGAKAVVFFSSNTLYGDPMKKPAFYTDSVGIAVMYLQKPDFIDTKNPGTVSFTVNINRSGTRIGHNVGGYMDNKAKTTVVIGAHYDHLGMGFFSTRDPGVYDVHNGADDNASGVAGVLELARQLKNADLKNNNYIFLAFSGEEKGLFGSMFFMKSNYYPKQKLNYMLDLDMIGRLKPTNKLQIFGMSASGAWGNTITKVEHPGLKIVKPKIDLGGSDHMSFNMYGVPAILIITGLHPDYHKAVDDANLINFEGENRIVNYLINLIAYLNDKGKLEFKNAVRK
ncbi:MAG: M28 family peptidase [Bacteroidota bacterium]